MASDGLHLRSSSGHIVFGNNTIGKKWANIIYNIDTVIDDLASSLRWGLLLSISGHKIVFGHVHGARYRSLCLI